MLNQIKTIFADEMDYSSSANLRKNTVLEDLQLDEMDMSNIFIAIEDAFGVEFSEDVLESIETLGDIASYIEENV